MKRYIFLLLKIILNFFRIGIYAKRKKSEPLELYKKYPNNSLRSRLFYNIGAGSFSHPYWTNVDKLSSSYEINMSDGYINYDLFSRSAIPAVNESAEAVYTSHTIEHIDDKSFVYLASEVHRMLKTEGVFRITCPDIDLAINALNREDYSFFEMNGKGLEGDIYLSFALYFSQVYDPSLPNSLNSSEIRNIINTESDIYEACNKITSLNSKEIQIQNPSYHCNWYSKNKILELLKTVGFSKIQISGYGQSQIEILRDTEYFDNTRPEISLYIEAYK